jgi:hypothetical protein
MVVVVGVVVDANSEKEFDLSTIWIVNPIRRVGVMFIVLYVRYTFLSEFSTPKGYILQILSGVNGNLQIFFLWRSSW